MPDLLQDGGGVARITPSPWCQCSSPLSDSSSLMRHPALEADSTSCCISHSHSRPCRWLHKQAVKLQARASLYFAVGLRFIFAVGPFILWMVGALAMLIGTVVEILALFLMDHVPVSAVEEKEEKVEEHGEERSQGEVNGAQAAPAP